MKKSTSLKIERPEIITENGRRIKRSVTVITVDMSAAQRVALKEVLKHADKGWLFVSMA